MVIDGKPHTDVRALTLRLPAVHSDTGNEALRESQKQALQTIGILDHVGTAENELDRQVQWRFLRAIVLGYHGTHGYAMKSLFVGRFHGHPKECILFNNSCLYGKSWDYKLIIYVVPGVLSTYR